MAWYNPSDIWEKNSSWAAPVLGGGIGLVAGGPVGGVIGAGLGAAAGGTFSDGGILGGGGSDQTSTSVPWSEQQPYLKDVYSAASDWFNLGAPLQPYSGDRVADFTPEQQQGLAQAMANIQSGNTSAQVGEGYLQNLLSGQDAQTNEINTFLSQLLAGNANDNQYLTQGTQRGTAGQGTLQSATGYIDQALNQQPTMSQNAINDVLAGKYLEQGNPYAEDIYQTAARQAMESFNQDVLPSLRTSGVNAGMSGSSRQALSEGQAAGDMSKSLSDIAAQIQYQQYEAERQRQMEAMGLGEQGRLADVSNMLAGSGLLNSIAGTQIGQEENYYNRLLQGAGLSQNYTDQQLQAAGLGQQGVQQQLQAAALAPELSNWGANQLYNLGSVQQAQNQDEIDAQMALWDEQQSQKLRALQGYQGLITGTGSGYGTTTQTGGDAGGGLLGALGGAGTGAALAGALGMENPWLLAGLGGLAGYGDKT